MSFRNLLFLDTETFGLSVDVHPVWEIAAVSAWIDEEGLHCLPAFVQQIAWPADVLAAADPEALELCRYHERFDRATAVDSLTIVGSAKALVSPLERYLWATLPDCITNPPLLVGVVPSFDARRLEGLVSHNPPWSHRLVDVRTLAMGQLLADGSRTALDVLGMGSEAVNAVYGVEERPDELHTALGDVHQAVRLFVAITGVPVEGLP